MTQRWAEFDALDLLVGVDDHGSLSAASRVAGMAQPNASRAVQKLERRLGLPLIERQTSGSTLTPQGTVIVHWARKALADLAQLLVVADGLRAQHSAELTVCASMTVAEHLLPRWLGMFRKADTETSIHLQVHNSTQVFEQIVTGACDVGFVESPSIPRGLHSVTVARDQLVVVVHPRHVWARRRTPVTMAELAATPLLTREPGSGTRTTLDVALGAHDRAAPLLELGSAAAIRTSVRGGVGPAVLSTLAVADELQSGVLRQVYVVDLDLTRSLRAVWKPPRQLSGPAGELVRIARR